MKKFLLGIMMSIAVAFVPAQTSITGRVLDTSGLKPVQNASIQNINENTGTYTDKDGFFQMKIRSFPAELQISHIGYEKIRISVDKKETFDPLNIRLEASVIHAADVLVTANRVIKGRTPVTSTNLSSEDIDELYQQQDVPLVLESIPGVYSYSDAGDGTGYSYLNIRGFSQDRISILYNGVPLNDPEAHAVYWVDHGDILQDGADIQVQRGTGNTIYGASAFGGSINMQTNLSVPEPGIDLILGYGNFIDGQDLNNPTQKVSFKYYDKTKSVEGLSFSFRISDLNSSGYRIGSGTEQQSAHAGIQLERPTFRTRAEFLRGHEETNFSWDGISPQYGYDLDDYDDRRYNFYADSVYHGNYYDVNKDVFTQSLFLLNHVHLLDEYIKLSGTVYYVGGQGYYQQFKPESDVEEYNLVNVFGDTAGVDLIRRKWLKNGYWGGILQATRSDSRNLLMAGLDARIYASDHIGKAIYVDGYGYIDQLHEYYSNATGKNSFSIFASNSLEICQGLFLQTDLRCQLHYYVMDQDSMGVFTDPYAFSLAYVFPDGRVGLTYNFNEMLSAYMSVSTAHREPSSNDLYRDDEADVLPAVADPYSGKRTDPLIEHEELIDYETGIHLKNDKISAALNAYYMDFRNELIPVYYRYRDADEVLRGNAPKTVHKGIETSASVRFLQFLQADITGSFSDNVFIEFTGDSLGWEGWGGIADYSGKTIPGFPSVMVNARLSFNNEIFKAWLSCKYTGKQYIDFANNEAAAINPSLVLDLGFSFPFDLLGFHHELQANVMNVTNALYETFGYNYYNTPSERIDSYWPAATRQFYLTWKICIGT